MRYIANFKRSKRISNPIPISNYEPGDTRRRVVDKRERNNASYPRRFFARVSLPAGPKLTVRFHGGSRA